jgi:uncharacterized protein
MPTLPFHHALGALGPIAAAFLVSAVETGVAGPTHLVRRMGLWRGRLVWVAVALAERSRGSSTAVPSLVRVPYDVP